MPDITEIYDDDELADFVEFLSNREVIESGKGELADDVSDLIKKTPIYGEETVLYRYYKDNEGFDDAGELTEPGFIIGSDKPLPPKDGARVLKITVPGNLPAVWLPGGGYLLDRALNVRFDGTGGGKFVRANIGGSLTASGNDPKVFGHLQPMIRFNTGWIPTSEEQAYLESETHMFHQSGEHDQRTHGGGGFGPGGGDLKSTKEARRARNRARLRATKEVVGDIATLLAQTVVAVGAGYTLYRVAKSGQPKAIAPNAPLRG